MIISNNNNNKTKKEFGSFTHKVWRLRPWIALYYSVIVILKKRERDEQRWKEKQEKNRNFHLSSMNDFLMLPTYTHIEGFIGISILYISMFLYVVLFNRISMIIIRFSSLKWGQVKKRISCGVFFDSKIAITKSYLQLKANWEVWKVLVEHAHSIR